MRILWLIFLGCFLPGGAFAKVPAVAVPDSTSHYLKKASSLAMNNFPKAITYLDKADSLATLSKNEEQLADIAYAYGVAYYVKGDYGNALIYFLEAEESYTAQDNKAGMAKGQLGQGLILQGMDRHIQADKYFRRAIELYREAGDYSAASPAYINIAISEIEQKDYDSAEEHIQLAIKLSQKSGRTDVRHIALNRLGEIYLIRGNPQAAIEIHNQVLFDKIQPTNWEKSFANAGLAQAFAEQGELSLAEEHGLLAVAYATTSHSLWDLQRNTKILSEIYKTQGETAKALEYLELHVAYKDSLYDQEKLQELNFLNLEAKEAENQTLQAEKELAEKRLFINRVAIFSLILLVLFLIVLLFLFRNKKKQKETFHRELEEKNRTILEQNKLIQERNQKLDEANKTKDRFFSIISHDLRSPIGSIQQLLEMMKSGEFTPEEQAALFDEMYQQVSGTSFMLNNLLTWAGTQLDGSNVKPEEVFLPKEVAHVLQAYLFSAKQKQISITHETGSGGNIFIDKAHLSVILHNLVSNAIKFTVEGGNIAISYFEREAFLDVVIADGGEGISEEKIQEILTVNTRIVSQRGTGMESGTGLGLLVVKEFLRANNATLHITSRPGDGSVFTVSFPKAG